MLGLTPFNRSAVRRSDEKDDFFDMIDEFFNNSFYPNRNLRQDTFKIDVKDEGDFYTVEADLPGIKNEEVELNYQDGQLLISINRKEEKKEEKNNYIHRERKLTSMRRAINLGDLVTDQIEAELKDGILNIKAPKAAQIEQKTRIQIK
ncbi:MAG: Hsp20 family protein [Acholeplasmataceae bacterium]|nr:Hsp20 family protein [Acholeplasmataceae bacterium]